MLKSHYGEQLQLLYTDTDSFIFHVITQDLYADMKLMSDHLYTCGYPISHPLLSDHNKKVMGKFKDEGNSLPIIEFIGLKAKMYSVLYADIHSHSTAKGIKK